MDSLIIDSSKLTNKQKKAIRKEFNEYANCPNKGEVTRIFIWLFGEEFFK